MSYKAYGYFYRTVVFSNFVWKLSFLKQCDIFVPKYSNKAIFKMKQIYRLILL